MLRTSARRALVCLVILATAVLVVPGRGAAAGPNSVHGTLSPASGDSFDYLTYIRLYELVGGVPTYRGDQRVTQGTTPFDFSFTGIADSNNLFILCVQGQLVPGSAAGSYPRGCYSAGESPATAQGFVLSGGVDYAASFTLRPRRTLHGKVTTVGDRPVSTRLTLYRDDTEFGTVNVGADGLFSLPLMASTSASSGLYKMHLDGGSTEGDFTAESWWSAETSLATATPIDLTADREVNPQVRRGAPSLTPLRVTGSPHVGQVLRAVNGTWDHAKCPGGLSYTYRWRVTRTEGTMYDNVGTGPTYTLRSSDRGAQVQATVTAAGPSCGKGFSESGLTSPVGAMLPVSVTSGPTITGRKKVGKRLSAHAGSFTGGSRLSFQWLRNGHAIGNAHGASYKLRQADKGKHVAVRITYTHTGYVATVRTSPRTVRVKKA